jgi:arabinan endo-1,5-alpha-L-arabinosidase
MLRLPLKLIAVAALALSGCATPLARSPVAGTYVNPVLDADFPDPVVLKAPDGFYYAYATQTEIGGKWVNIQLARSPDLVNWRHLGLELPANPVWA